MGEDSRECHGYLLGSCPCHSHRKAGDNTGFRYVFGEEFVLLQVLDRDVQRTPTKAFESAAMR